MTTQTITRNEFAALLDARGGCAPVGILTVTQPKMRKTGNPFSVVSRICRRNGFVGGDYESIVNNKQEREGGERDFEAEPLPWGRHVSRFFIAHNGALYLKFFSRRAGVEGVDLWLADGKAVPEEAVQPFLSAHKESASGVAWRAIKLDNVQEVVMDGQTFSLTGGATE